MDTRFLETFVQVVETGSIAGAARNMNLTAASVSQRLKSLEGSLGSRLIVRSGRTVKPPLARRWTTVRPLMISTVTSGRPSSVNVNRVEYRIRSLSVAEVSSARAAAGASQIAAISAEASAGINVDARGAGDIPGG